MIVKRIIHSVGQGAFYAETFDNGKSKLNVVYDCGSYWDNGKKKLTSDFENIINGFKNEYGGVDVLFVSHFHLDHINGIDCLLKGCSKNVKVFMPALSYSEKTYYYISNLLSLGGPRHGSKTQKWLWKFLFNGQNLGDDSKIDIKEVGIDDYESYVVFVDTTETLKFVSAKTILDREIWQYVPMPFCDNKIKEVADNLYEKLKSIGVIDEGNACIELSEKNDVWEDVKSVYNEVVADLGKKRNINENNMVLMLYSTPVEYCRVDYLDYGLRPLSCLNNHIYKCLSYIKPACLYVGDVESKDAFKTIENRMSKIPHMKFPYNVGLVQLSHHGSHNGMNDKLKTINSLRCFCCYGSKNTYGHPSFLQIDGFLTNDYIVYTINEKDNNIEEIIEIDSI